MNDKRTKLTEQDWAVFGLLGKGPENAISRTMLVALTGLDDLNVRRSIKHLRLHGKPIANHFSGEGYFIATDPQQLTPVITGLRSRRNTLDREIYHLTRAAQNFEYVHNKIEGE